MKKETLLDVMQGFSYNDGDRIQIEGHFGKVELVYFAAKTVPAIFNDDGTRCKDGKKVDHEKFMATFVGTQFSALGDTASIALKNLYMKHAERHFMMDEGTL